MLKKLGLSLLCAAATLSSNVYALQNNALQNGTTIDYDLKPNVAQLFTNYTFFTVTANCKITTEDESDVFYAIALAQSGKIDDQPLSKGQSTRVTVRNGQTMVLSANKGAQVSITNEGLHTVKVSCTSV
jgi:hypothetical protein